MTDEERKAILWLSALDIKSEYEATNKEIVLNLINKQEKAIDRMAEVLNNQDIDYLCLCDNCKNSNEECHGDYCEERIKEYFMEDKE